MKTSTIFPRGWWQLRPVGGSRSIEKWPNRVHLRIALTLFHEGLRVWCKGRVKIKDDSIFFS